MTDRLGMGNWLTSNRGFCWTQRTKQIVFLRHPQPRSMSTFGCPVSDPPGQVQATCWGPWARFIPQIWLGPRGSCCLLWIFKKKWEVWKNSGIEFLFKNWVGRPSPVLPNGWSEGHSALRGGPRVSPAPPSLPCSVGLWSLDAGSGPRERRQGWGSRQQLTQSHGEGQSDTRFWSVLYHFHLKKDFPESNSTANENQFFFPTVYFLENKHREFLNTCANAR